MLLKTCNWSASSVNQTSSEGHEILVKKKILSTCGTNATWPKKNNKIHPLKSSAIDYRLRFVNIRWSCDHIERFHSRRQHLCKFIGTKQRVCIRKEFNSQRIGLGHQHGRRFIVLGHQYGRRDVMWKHSIMTGLFKESLFTATNFVEFRDINSGRSYCE